MKLARVALTVVLGSSLVVSFVSADASPRIVANQLGVPRQRAQAIVIADRQLKNRDISADDGSLKSVRIAKRVHDTLLGAWVHTVDLTPGTADHVTVTVSGGSTRRIPIVDGNYRDLQRSLLRSYFLQRCGIAIADPLTHGDHAACHLADGVRAHADASGPEGAAIAGRGGWHDAGDYGKYVATTAAVVLELLTRYERYPTLLGDDDLAIPESGNGAPDVLDEMRVGLDWMLAMQRSDGAVYRKLSGAAWPKAQAPETDQQRRFVYGVSSADSAKAAAAWALAARVYQQSDRATAQRYLAAARTTWSWLESLDAHQVFDFHDGDNSGSGPYMAGAVDREKSLTTDDDDRLAAAIELFLTTGEPAFARVVDQLLPGHAIAIFEWKDIAALPVTSLLWHPAARERVQWKRLATSKLRARAAQSLARSQQHSFSVANHRFVWGSNKMTAEEGVLMLAAARLGDARRLEAAGWSQLNYLLGANPLDKVFVTGFGDNPVKHVSHLFIRASGHSFPGLFVGGPNELEQSNIGPRGRGPLSYADDERSYATNEYAIDYDSALLGLLIDLRATKLPPYPSASLASAAVGSRSAQ